MARYSTQFVKSPPCRFSYINNLFVPVKKTNDAGVELLNEDGTPKLSWQVTAIFSKKDDTSVLDQLAEETVKGEWGDKAMVRYQNGLIRSPFLDGVGKQAHSAKTGELNPGMGPDVFFLRLSANKRPAIHYRSPMVPATADEIKSGDYGFVALNCYAWNNSKSGDGISFGLEFLQKMADGERLGGSGTVDPGKWHEKIEDAGPAPSVGSAGAGSMFG